MDRCDGARAAVWSWAWGPGAHFTLGAPEQYERIVEMMMQHAAAAEGEEVDAANLVMI